MPKAISELTVANAFFFQIYEKKLIHLNYVIKLTWRIFFHKKVILLFALIQ